MFALSLQAWAQDSDDIDIDTDGTGRSQKTSDDMDSMSDAVEMMPSIHITFSDVLWVAFIILACYVFGKIWKGCTYLIIIVAGILYYLLRY